MRLYIFVAAMLMAVVGWGMPDSARLERFSSPVLNNMGRKSLDAGRHGEALLPLSIVARRYYEKPDDPQRRRAAVTAMHWLGVYYMDGTPDYGMSYEYTATAIAIAEEDGLYAELPNLYSNMASLMTRANILGSAYDKPTVTDYLKKAYHLAVKTNNIEALLTSINNMLQMLPSKEYTAEINDFRRRRLPNSPDVEYTRYQVKVYDALLAGDTTAAIENTLAASRLAQKFSTEKSQGAVFKAAWLHSMQGHPLEACRLLQQELSRSRALSDTTAMVYIYGNLASFYEMASMMDSARDNRLRYYELSDQTRRRQQKGVQEARLTRQVEQVNQDLREMSLTRQRREKQLLWLGGVTLLLIVGAVWLLTARRSQSRHLRELYEQNVKLLNTLDLQRRETTNPPTSTEGKPKYQASPMDEEMGDELYRRVEQALNSNPAVFDSDFSLETLATSMNINTRYLSQAINTHGTGFPQMLSAVRIEEACRRFRDREKWGPYTVEAIAQSVGMSRSSFGTLFKKATGMTPAQYRRQVGRADG